MASMIPIFIENLGSPKVSLSLINELTIEIHLFL